jgi:hypothetical protein
VNAKVLAASAALSAMSMPAAGQSPSDWQSWPTASRWSIGAGYFAPDLDTTIIVTDENQVIGSGISFERDLGLDDSEATGLFYINWRMLKRHALEYRYFQLDRSATVTSSTVTIAIGEEEFDGKILNANAGIQWNAFEHIGFFLQYQVFDVDVDYTDRGVLWAIDYDYTGPVLGVDVRF